MWDALEILYRIWDLYAVFLLKNLTDFMNLSAGQVS